MITVSNISLQYGKRILFDEVNVKFVTGNCYGVIGANGAGKTTTFYMMVGLEPTEHGSISIGDQDVTHLPMYLRARLGVGYLPQEPSIFRRMTAVENLLAGAAQSDDLERLLFGGEVGSAHGDGEGGGA